MRNAHRETGVRVALNGSAATGVSHADLEAWIEFPADVPELYRQYAQLSVVPQLNTPAGKCTVTLTAGVKSLLPGHAEVPWTAVLGSRRYDLWAVCSGMTGSTATAAIVLPTT